MLNLYSVEFTLKYHKGRHISDATLNEFLAKAKARSRNFKPHQYPIGYTNNRQNGFVHFYSDADFYGIQRIAENFAKSKTYGFVVKQTRFEKKATGGTIGTGGIMAFLKRKVTLKGLLGK